ncbi:MAG: cytochrome c oxidase assembly protein [Planctomycetia bacterium]|nr:cytochrome c oxidase assembly protein [Planctomycetia bacterium]
MDATLAAILRCWSCSAWIVVPLLCAAAVYTAGWRRLRRRGATEFSGWRLGSFLGAIVAVYISLLSPLDTLAPLLLTAHMAQHLLLIFVVAPLVWLAAPELPMLAGLPAVVRRDWVVPLMQLRIVRRTLSWLVRPVPAWTAAAVLVWLWHAPVLYEWALRNSAAHDLEHVSFLASSLMFWWPVLVPYPRKRAFSAWLLLPYLLLAGVQGGILAAVLTFSDRVLYPYYEAVPRLGGISALHDQAIAGAMMWVAGIVASLVPLIWLGGRLFRGELDRHLRREPGRPSIDQPQRTYYALPIIDFRPSHNVAARRQKSAQTFDLLKLPLLGRLLRAKHTRTILQSMFLVAALLVMLDGLLGPQMAPLNLAGVLPWIHWRAMVVLGLIVAGNAFCMVCPFTQPRRMAAGWLPASWRWPEMLRNKWPAVVLVVLFFWGYELFSFWDSPWWTAWLIGGYFIAAFAIDGLFRGTPFCKYVCPIGQFNFVYSLVSPLQVAVRSPQVCLSCESHACLKGRAEVPGGQNLPGCEMDLFQPRKHDNLDCTFCLDCVRSCPHDNVGVLVAEPAAQLVPARITERALRDGRRAGLATMIVVLTAAAFMNAAWMIAPLATWQRRAEAVGGAVGRTLMVSGGTLLGLVVIPAVIIALVASWSRRAGNETESWRANARRYCRALIPLGCAMWAAHYGFHLLTGAGTIVGAGSRFLADLGISQSVAAAWSCPCCSGGVAAWLLPFQFVLIDVGLLASLYVVYRIACQRHERSLRALAAGMPWMLMVLVLFGIGVAIFLEPMQMRGTITAVAGGPG